MEFCVEFMNARRIFIHWAAIRLSGDDIARLITFSELEVLGLGFLHTLMGLNLGMFIPPQWHRGTRRCGTTPAVGFIGHCLQPIYLFFKWNPWPLLV